MRVCIWLSIIGIALATSESTNRIIGGEPTTIEKYPFAANLQQALNGHLWTVYCGGAILTRSAVLTAALCVDGYPAFLWRVAVGSVYGTVPAGGTIHPVLSFTIHPDFRAQTMDNNVAIVHLLIPVEYSERVQPARIPVRRYFIPDGTKLTAIGWGAYNHFLLYPNILQRVELELLHQGICWTRYWQLQRLPQITDGMMCAGFENQAGKGICERDDGGPLVLEDDIVVGLASWQHDCNSNSMYPSVFTRVSHYSDWIIENINND